LTFQGNTGHGSRFIEKTAAEKLQRFLNLVLAFREEQKAKYKNTCGCMKLGDVTTINLTGLTGGLARNLVPAEFEAIFDIRITPKNDVKEIEKMIARWIEEAEGDDADSGRISVEIKSVRFFFLQ
jgi:aminoacylase